MNRPPNSNAWSASWLAMHYIYKLIDTRWTDQQQQRRRRRLIHTLTSMCVLIQIVSKMCYSRPLIFKAYCDHCWNRLSAYFGGPPIIILSLTNFIYYIPCSHPPRPSTFPTLRLPCCRCSHTSSARRPVRTFVFSTSSWSVKGTVPHSLRIHNNLCAIVM